MNKHKTQNIFLNTPLYVSFRRIFPVLVKIALIIIIARIWTTSSHAQIHDVCSSGCAFSAIQDAIDHADSGDTITISGDVFYEHLSITNSDPTSVMELTLVGAGAGVTIVDGNASDVVLRVGVNTEVTISGITIQNGATPGYYYGESWKIGNNTVYEDEDIDTNFEFITGDPPNTLVSYTSGHDSMLYWWGQSFTTPQDTAPQPIIGFRFFKADGMTPTGAGTGYLYKGSSLPSYNIEDIPKFSIASGSWNGSYYDLYDSSGNRLVTEPGQKYIFISLSDTAFEVGITSIGLNPGGGIVNGGDLHLLGVHVKNNESITTGGGIWNSGELTIEDCEVSGNKALEGGGIFIRDTPSPFPGEETPIVTITNSLIINNTAIGSGLAGSGGGIYVGQNGELKIYGSTVSDNSASIGGGIATEGSWNTVDTYIENSLITNNTAKGGGGLFNYNGTMTIISSTIQGNTAERMGGGLVNSPQPKYGIARLYLVDSTVSYNEVTATDFIYFGGGGIFNGQAFPDVEMRAEPAIAYIENSTIHHNTTNAISGGGIKTTSCATTIENSTISGNAAPQGGGIAFEVYFYDNTRCIPEPWFAIHSSTITGNSDGGMYFHNIDFSTLNLTNTIIGLNNGYDCNGEITSEGGNLDSDNTCTLSPESDIPGKNPLLGPLQDNGGPTWTHKPLPGSPTVDPFFVGYPGGETYLSGGGAFNLQENADVDFQILTNPEAPVLLLENLIGLWETYNFVGQSITIPGDATELELSGFRFMFSDHVTPSGSGMGYLFTEAYTGAPGDLDSADYVASAPWDAANNVYDFSGSGFSFTPGEKYWFYADAPVTAGLSAPQPCDTSEDQRHSIRPWDGNGDGTAVCDIGSVELLVPIADAGGPYSGEEGSAIPLDGTQSSVPQGNALNYYWTVDTPLCVFDNRYSSTPNLTCSDNGNYTLTLVVENNDASSSDTASVSVNNVAPIASIENVSPAMVAFGESVNVNGSFTDPGANDTHTAMWDWGDGVTSSGNINGNNVGPNSHAYSEPGIYTVILTVWDDEGDQGEDSFEYVVVYDPDGGFVTGSGWIKSPEGAYRPDPSLIGKATFGFVSKYKKGTTIPTGNTEFQFHTAGFNFHSSVYDWLVVAGAKAMFKGTGTINGEGSYKFMISAIDGQINGGGGIDKFRIKIWEEINDVEYVIYDNQIGADEAADPTSVLGGGSIVIHSGK